MIDKLPAPACEYGFTHQQVREIFYGFGELEAFQSWMHGQTAVHCPLCGPVVYEDDLARYHRGERRVYD